MRNRIWFILAALIFFIGKTHSQQTCEISKLAFSKDESLNYEVYYHWGLIWANAGEANFSINKEALGGRKVFYISGTGKTYGSYDWFYKVRDKFESWVDTATLKPIRHIRNTKEGGTKIYNDNYFKKNTAICYKIEKNIVKKDSVKFEECTFDVLTMIYYARCIDYSKYKQGDKIPIKLYLDGEVHDSLYIRFLGKEKLKTEIGEKNCIMFSPLLIKGTIFSGGEKMTVWVTDDDKKIPVLIKTPIVVGEIQVKIRKEIK